MNSEKQEIEKRRILDPLIDKIFGSSRSSGTKNISKRTEALASRISNDLISTVKMTSRIEKTVQRNQESILTKPVVGLDTSKAVKILDNMLSFMQKSREQDTQDSDTQRSFNEMNEYAAADRHKEIMDVFIQATKKKRQVQNKMARETKNRKGVGVAGVIAAGVAGVAAVAVAGVAAIEAAVALALKTDEPSTGTVNPDAGELGNREPDYRIPPAIKPFRVDIRGHSGTPAAPAPDKPVPAIATPTDLKYKIVIGPDTGPKSKLGPVNPPDNQDGATAPPPKGKDGRYPFVTSGPNKGKRWSPTTPGPTIPGGVATPAPIKTTKRATAIPAPIKTTEPATATPATEYKIEVGPDPGPKPKPVRVKPSVNRDGATPAPPYRVNIDGVGRGSEEAPTPTAETDEDRKLYIDKITKELSLPIPEELKVGGKWAFENLVPEQKEAIDNLFIATGMRPLYGVRRRSFNDGSSWNEVLIKRSPIIQKKIFDEVNEEVKLERKKKLEDVNAFKNGNPIPGLIEQRKIKLSQLKEDLDIREFLRADRIENKSAAEAFAKQEKLRRLSIEGADIKKDLSRSSSSRTVIVNQNNTTKKQKTVVVNPQKEEGLNPTMRN